MHVGGLVVVMMEVVVVDGFVEVGAGSDGGGKNWWIGCYC
jgi:hypothetical protein